MTNSLTHSVSKGSYHEEKMETSGNEAYGVVEPQYEVVGL